MTIYNLYIFNSGGQCIYYWEWNRTSVSNLTQDEEFKLMFGMIYSIKSFINRLSHVDGDNQLFSYATNKHRMHFLETPTKLKFVLNTDLQTDSQKVREVLNEIYANYYIEYVIKNPFCDPKALSIDSNLFTKQLREYISSLTIFN